MSEKVITLPSARTEEDESSIKENPPGECCDTCNYHFQVGIRKEGLKKIVICRRYPPTVGFFPGPLNRPVTGADYPPVDPNHWCGEWKQRISRVLTH